MWHLHRTFQLILPLSLKRFKFLAEKLNTLQPASTPSSDALTQQLGQYLTEVQTISFGAGSAFTALEFWKTKQAIYPKLAPVALDILVAPAYRPMSKGYFQSVDCCVQGAEIVFVFTWCSVTDSEKEVNAKCLS